MTPELNPCRACEQLIIAGTCVCPHCGEAKACGSRLGKTAALLGLTVALTGCVGTGQALYAAPAQPEVPDRPAETGQQAVDADGDGHSVETDCDDTNAAVHPGATETPGDKLDSNCDGNDDT